MWRFLAGIPRVACAGVRQCNVRQRCLDDEKKTRVDHLINPWCKATNNHGFSTYHGGRRSQREEYGPEHEQYEWRKLNFDFWQHLNQGRHCGLEAVGWGAAVVLGIHLSKLSQLHGDQGEFSRGHKSVCRLLYRVAHASPQLDSITTQKHNLPPGQTPATKDKRQADSKQVGDEGPNALDQVFTEFEDLCQRYSATGNNIAGLQHAAQNNMATAVHHWKEASKLGCAKAQFNLALCYESGIGVDVNLTEAVRQYNLAGNSGHAEALYNLAVLYLSGKVGVEPDVTRALQLMDRAAQLGLAQAQTYLGVYYTEGEKQDLAKAVALFKAAAAQKDSEAQYFLGICHEQGWGADQNECKAAEYYRQASVAGHDGAIYNLAVFHEFGLGGLPVNVEAALPLYEQSAEAGNDNATHSLQRLKAAEATAEWNRQAFAQDICQPTLKETGCLKSPASSPSLTDYVREHLDELTSTQLPWINLDHVTISRSFLDADQPAAHAPQFYIGGTDSLSVHGPYTSANHTQTSRPKFRLGGPGDLTETIEYAEAGHTSLFTTPRGLARPASLFDLRVACT